MAQVLCVYRECERLEEAAARRRRKQEASEAVTVISYDEKPGIQAIATTAPDLRQSLACTPTSPASLNTSATARQLCWPGSISSPAKSTALVKDRHRSRSSSTFSSWSTPAYPTHTAIRLILDNHSPTSPKRRCMARRPTGVASSSPSRQHGSWLNLVEGFFSKFARSVLRHIASHPNKNSDRIMAAMITSTRTTVVHTWSYKLKKAA